MGRVREVGTLWIGGALSWMEQLCLKSFVDAGQKITLYSYEDIPNVPAGVIRRDGREVLDTDDFIKYEKKDSFALFADLFRIHMIAQNPGLIWVDTDVYCHRPIEHEGDYVMGFELPGETRVNNAVLGLPADSAILADILDFMSDRAAIPEFVKPALRAEYQAAKAAGRPVHVSQQPWGVWGPMMISHFVAKHRLKAEVQPLDAYYPITFPDRTKFLKAEKVAAKLITPRTTALHIWASNKRELGLRHGGLPPPGSYLAMLVAKHGIRPETAPIKGRGRRLFDAGLIDAVDLPEVASFADVGGTAQSLALAAHAKWDCDIALIDLTHKGEWPEKASDWVAPYRAFLAENGVEPARVRVVRDAASLRPTDLVANLSGFGDVNKIKHLAPVLEACIHADSRMLLDIRKGSGSYPFLKERGTLEALSSRDDGGVEITRARFTPLPPAATETDPAWAEIARSLAGPEGFYRDNGSHSFLYIPRGRTLVVTFDNLDIAMNKREERRPWGFHFIEKQGWSMLGVMAGGWTWYRDPWVASEFDRLAATGFFAQFERVVFYGASMGGYAACAFAGACPGADVVAISPQSTLDRALVPWETRYKVAWDRDWSDTYGDAAVASRSARRVSILYDPYEPLDAGHAARFTAPNAVKLRAPLLGHRLGSSLHQMGILNPIILAALDGSLTEAEFYRRLRARREFPRYQRELFKRAIEGGHPALARRLGHWVLARGDNRLIRQEMARL
ncbi:hypothetical protein [Phaeovulum sp.]|uniref:hypothetical protein n=1 Tax=Phaeovulum sp. TaxID=2934796 RepID=UPI002730324F|nr:hypothetical protein [Phaeovulum sp.]MDP1667685.1 hypothetical protein [Phaeovulum sp.]MDZ4118424.1 hypothetical protein [Phaeovulum sp.]